MERPRATRLPANLLFIGIPGPSVERGGIFLISYREWLMGMNISLRMSTADGQNHIIKAITLDLCENFYIIR